jgi:hypothetical protein
MRALRIPERLDLGSSKQFTANGRVLDQAAAYTSHALQRTALQQVPAACDQPKH